MYRRYLWFVLGLGAAVFFGGCGESESKKGVNDPCLSNTDCADSICHAGCCAASNPKSNGEDCGGKGECRSFVCTSGKCVPGTNPLGTACLYNEECESTACVGGFCASTQLPDVGPGKPDAGPDGARTDGPPADLARDTVVPVDADVTAPEVTSIKPGAGSTLGAVTPIVVTFSESVKPSSVSLGGELGLAAANPSWAKSDTEMTLLPASVWPDGVSRSLQLEFSDLVGNKAAPCSYTYVVDSSPPAVTGISPASDYRPWTSFVVTFSKDMDPTTLILSGDIGTAKVKQWSSAKQVELEPQTSWNVGNGKNLYLEGKDTMGNPLQGSPVKHSVDVHWVVAAASQGDVGEQASLVVGSTGNDLYLSYFDRTNNALMWLKSADGGKSWATPVTVDSIWTKPSSTPPAIFGRSSLAVVGGKAYLSYQADTDGNGYEDIAFLRSDDLGVTWDKAKRKVIATGSYDGVCCTTKYAATNSLATSGGKVHLQYEEYYSNSMVPPAGRGYVFRRSDDDGETWPAATKKDVSWLYDDGYTASYSAGLLVLGSTVYGAHMAATYGPPNTYLLRLARSDDDGANWPGQFTVESQGSSAMGQYLSFAAHGFGGLSTSLYLSYYDAKNGDLKFARSDNNGQSWAAPQGLVTKVDGDGTSSPPVVGKGTAIAVDATGDKVYIAYYDETNKDLKFVRSDDKGATWPVVRTVDTKLDVGQYPAIALSGSGASTVVTISYYDESNKDLKLARSTDNGSSW